MSTSKKVAVPFAIAAVGLLLVMLLPAGQSTHAAFGNYGTQVNWDDADYAPRFTNISANMHIARVDNSAGLADDVYYLHFGASSDTQTGSSDLIIAGTGVGTFATAGIVFSAVDTDLFSSDIHWLEGDGKFGYTPGDFLYYSDDGTLAAETSPGFGDFPLATVTGAAPLSYAATAGTIITSATDAVIVNATGTIGTAGSNGILPDDGDRASGGAQFTGTGFTVQYADKNGNDVRDNLDAYKITLAPDPNVVFFNIGDTILGTAGGYTHGTRVTSSTTKEIPLLENNLEARAQFVYTVPTGTNDTTTRGYYIHFWDSDVSNNTINIGDICIRDPALSCTYGTRVTSVATGYGKSIGCKTPLQGVLMYLEADNIGGYTDADNVYYNLPSTCFGGTSNSLTLTAGDIRATTIASPSFAAGTQVVDGNGDPGLVGAATGNLVSSRWYYQLYDEDKSSPVPLTLCSNCKIVDRDGDGGYDQGEGVYVGAVSSGVHAAPGSVVAITDFRLHVGYGGGGTNSGVSTTNTSTAVVAGNFDVGATLITPALTYRYRIWVTGLDGVFDPSKSEYVYASNDSFVNWGDVRILAHSASTTTIANSTVATSQAIPLSSSARDMVQFGPGVSERTFFNWCRGGQSISAGGAADCLGGDGAPLLLRPYDVEVVSGGTRLSVTSAEQVPWLMQLRGKDAAGTDTAANQTLVRYNRGDTGALTDDTLYFGLNPAGGTGLASRYLRVTGYDSTRPAGKAIASSSAETGASAGEVSNGSVILRQRIRFIDVDANGYTKGDFVVIDNPAGSGGTNDGTYGFGDIRLTPTGATLGATSSPAGTIRVNGEPDQTFTTFGTPSSSRQFHIYWYDVNRDNSTSFEELGHDRAYAMYVNPATLGQTGGQWGGNASERKPITPLLNSVRIVGAGGATGATGTATAAGATTTAATVPTLGSAAVTPSQCVAANAALTFSVTYTDSLNRAPSTNNLIFNSVTSAMTTTATSYTGGASYTKATTAPATAGTYASSFSFSNAGGTATLAGPTIVVMPTDNVAPTLTVGGVSPLSGEGGASFTYSVTYTDLNNNAPTVKKVKIDGVDNDMTSADTVYCDGAVFTFTKTLGSGPHTFAFEFSDGTTTVKLPATETSAGPTVTGGSVTDTPTTTSKSTSTTPAKKKPTPGFDGVLVLAALVGVAVAIAVYRRK